MPSEKFCVLEITHRLGHIVVPIFLHLGQWIAPMSNWKITLGFSDGKHWKCSKRCTQSHLGNLEKKSEWFKVEQVMPFRRIAIVTWISTGLEIDQHYRQHINEAITWTHLLTVKAREMLSVWAWDGLLSIDWPVYSTIYISLNSCTLTNTIY